MTGARCKKQARRTRRKHEVFSLIRGLIWRFARQLPRPWACAIVPRSSAKHEDSRCSPWQTACTNSAPRPPSRCSRAPRRSRPRAAAIINLGIGQPDFPTPAHIVEAARKALADGHHGYTPANGILPLREAVAADLRRRLRAEASTGRRAGRAGRQGDDVLRDHDVRRSRRRDPLPQPRLPDLRDA